MRFALLKTILWLRWQLSRNQIRKAGRFVMFITTLLTALAGCAVVGALIGGFLAGRYPLARASDDVVMYVIDGIVAGFLFFWAIGILAEIQRSESVDLQRLLHLPVTLRDVFVVNFIASHVTFGVLLALPLITGLTIGLGLGRDGRFLVLLPLYLSFLFLVSAWTYCLRGWLVQLMVNPRRRRTIIIAMTMAVVLAAQLPNLFFNLIGRRASRGAAGNEEAMKHRLAQMQGLKEPLHYFLPPLWVGWGARKAAEGIWWPALGIAAGCLGGGAMGLGRAYRSTLRFYRGEGTARVENIPRLTPVVATSNSRPLEGRIVFASDAVSAAALAFLRSMTRAPELKMALLSPVMMLGIMAMVLWGHDTGEHLRRAAPLAAMAMTVFSFAGVLQVAFNQFGWDRTGFRALVLLPTVRAQILLAKNLATGAVMLALGLSVYFAVALLMRVSLLDHVAGWLQVVTAIIMLCVLGNYLSIMMPVRMNVGSLKPTKMPVATVLVMMLLTLALPFYMLPVLVGPALSLIANLSGSAWGGVLNLACSLGLLGVVLALYAVSLKPLGRLFWEREQRILDVVTAEVE